MNKPKIIIVGGGFGGLFAAKALKNTDTEVILIDKNNFHTFTPLLYQVATCGLDPSEIAYPIRGILRKFKNTRFLMGQVTEINSNTKTITIKSDLKTYTESYDYLIIATGTVTNFFNNPALAAHAFGLKDLQDSVRLRNHILKLFEEAAWTKDSRKREALTTIAVVGGGPTGLETAGALYELYNDVLSKEYNRTNSIRARVILIEATNKLLTPYPERLQKAAIKQLEGLGVEVVIDQSVQDINDNIITLSSGETIHTQTLIWAAGVKASPVTQLLNVELKRGGRVPVKKTLEVIGHDSIYAVGDIAYLEDSNQQPYPQVIPVAQQQGRLAAKNILASSQQQQQDEFKYNDRGIMATIGRRRAVAYPFYKVHLSGYIAWVTWLFLHLVWLIGFRNKLNVLINWIWNYFTYDRSVRIILEHRDNIVDE